LRVTTELFKHKIYHKIRWINGFVQKLACARSISRKVLLDVRIGDVCKNMLILIGVLNLKNYLKFCPKKSYLSYKNRKNMEKQDKFIPIQFLKWFD
jgi:hypothetical protein